MKVYTKSVQFKADQKLIDFIEKKISKMDNYFDRIINATVTLKLENSGQVRDKIAELRLSVPGEVIVTKASSKTFEESVDDSVKIMKRQLKRYKEKLRRHS